MVATLRLLLLALLAYGATLSAQNSPELPRFFTEEEKALLPVPGAPGAPAFGFTDPPALPVRSMGEWEELQAVLITWRGQSAILAEIVRAARLECRVIICCNDAATITSAKNYLTGKGVDFSTNVDFLIVPNNSIWVRDYGPNCVYANDVDSLYFVDWRYNRTTRPQDDSIANAVSKSLGIPLYRTLVTPNDLVHTGGNFMSDGMGTAFSSRLVLSENAPGNPYGASVKTENQIDGIMSAYMGINRYIKMEPLPYDGIHHIDMHMKLLDEETLLVGKYPDGIADGPQIEANIQYVLSNHKSTFGTPYKVIRIPMPPENGAYPHNGGDYRTYANAVFVNKTVIVPFYETQFDTVAKRVWQEALPGYTIVGIDCNSIIPSLGAIHCITKEVGVADPLRIVHQELPCMDNATFQKYPVWATVQHRDGLAWSKIYYTTDLNEAWQSVDLPLYPMDDTTWTHRGYIPKQPAGSTVYYYIEAASTTGKTVIRPLTAPAGYWSFCVTESVGSAQASAANLAPIYPNPASAITVIPVQASAPTQGHLALYNALGQLQQTIFAGQIPAGTNNYFIDAAHFPAGTYWVTLQTDGGAITQKLIIQ